MSIYIFEVCWFHFLLYHGCTLSPWPSKGQIKMAAVDISFLHFILKKKYISYEYININQSFLTCRNINCLNYVKKYIQSMLRPSWISKWPPFYIRSSDLHVWKWNICFFKSRMPKVPILGIWHCSIVLFKDCYYYVTRVTDDLDPGVQVIYIVI